MNVDNSKLRCQHFYSIFKRHCIECWWDQIILDVLLCNALGIEVGIWLCKQLEVKEYRWSGMHLRCLRCVCCIVVRDLSFSVNGRQIETIFNAIHTRELDDSPLAFHSFI